jgi:adenine-specific DNA methylase
VSGKVGQTFLSAQGGAGVPPASVRRQKCPRHLAARRHPTQLYSQPGQARQDHQRPQDTSCTTPVEKGQVINAREINHEIREKTRKTD